jgi:dihydrofolate synthase/folylpolyglutamate synthase
VSEDKDVSGMIQAFRSNVVRIIASKSVHPRALDPTEIIEIAKKRGVKGEAIVPIGSALRKAIHYWDENSVIIATGSIFVAAAVKEIWNGIKEHNRKSK